ncbi:MAG: NADH-quinone oxidoreductase subunit NuoE [Rhodobacteraceae bacterium CG17_big_fil_post_rev_8_21_14_2_50_63_15]|nr:NADH-quinone oxidoreductase subunit E [Roseovarius sp.]PIV79840.1 MAG: NADH-quinone oxidoreductase subunit NuoE [Rhodobacteraceae bacterium CG17_big_fil_post_rev_8_21_14_2_50_63_15]
MLRRLYHEQPESFAFTPANLAWAEGQISKYPEARQASAIIPLLWRAQEQEGWLSRPAIEHVADMLGMDYIRALEVATFYFMFQLQPVGSVAHFQICGTLTCMICGAEDLIGVCKAKIAPNAFELSPDGKFSWEEVECLGACANAPMAQIGKDYYEDLTSERFAEIIDELAAGKLPVPGPQNGRYAAEPKSGLTTLKEFESGRAQYNGSVQRAVELGDTVKRIDGTEVPLATLWRARGANHRPAAGSVKLNETPVQAAPKSAIPSSVQAAPESRAEAVGKSKTRPAKAATPEPIKAATVPSKKPKILKSARKSGADDLKLIKGVGPKLEKMLHNMGFFHFDQVAAWTQGEVSWVDENLEGFKGRVSRDNWVEQAGLLAQGKETEFSARAKKGKVD